MTDTAQPAAPLVRLAPQGLTFAAPAEITVPGAAAPARLLIVWRHRSRSAVRELQRRATDDALTDAELLAEVIDGWGLDPHHLPDEGEPAPAWQGPLGADGQPAAYSAETLAQLLDDYPAAGLELWNAFLRALHTSRLGN